MIERDTELQITSEPAIAYSTCYRLPFLSLFHADCMEIMKQYHDKYFDLAIVDPPYGIGESNKQRKNTPCKRWKAAKNDIPYEKKEWDKNIPTELYFKEIMRISKDQIIWGGNYMTEYLPPRMGWIFWDKKNGDTDFSDGELAWTSFNKALRKFEWMWSGFKKQRPEERIHPTQKPVQLYGFILKNYATEGMKILDTHFGSGSIALAVDKANRLDKMNLHLTACEIDKEYIDKAIKRISESIKQGTLSF